MTTLQIEQTDRDCYFRVKVVPASSKTILVGVLDGMLKLRVTAVPEKGKANKSIVDFLAKKLGVKKNGYDNCRDRQFGKADSDFGNVR